MNIYVVLSVSVWVNLIIANVYVPLSGIIEGLAKHFKNLRRFWLDDKIGQFIDGFFFSSM